MKKRIDNEENFRKIEFDTNHDAVSYTETTGLMPSLPYNEYEIASYRAIDKYTEKPIAGQHSDKNPPKES